MPYVTKLVDQTGLVDFKFTDIVNDLIDYVKDRWGETNPTIHPELSLDPNLSDRANKALLTTKLYDKRNFHIQVTMTSEQKTSKIIGSIQYDHYVNFTFGTFVKRLARDEPEEAYTMYSELTRIFESYNVSSRLNLPPSTYPIRGVDQITFPREAQTPITVVYPVERLERVGHKEYWVREIYITIHFVTVPTLIP